MKIGVFTIWVLLTLSGFWKLFVYSRTPGPQRKSSDWPKESNLSRDKSKPTLVLFLHPRCPCSQATLGELERLMPFLQKKVKIFAVFMQPEGQSEEWTKQELWNRAKTIPEIDLFIDEKGREATRFTAQTSGQVFLFDKGAQLVFRGGITPLRGHMGDSIGRQAIISYVENHEVTKAQAPVFGCDLSHLPINHKGSETHAIR